MFIGKLDPRLMPVQYTVTKMHSKEVPAFLEQGNPFQGQTLSIGWRELISSGIQLHVTLPAGYMVNELILHFAQHSCPTSVAIVSADEKCTFFRYSGETGKAITEKAVLLPLNEELTQFIIEISADFSDIVLRNIEIYGAAFDGTKVFPTPGSLCSGEGFVSPDSFFTCSVDCNDAALAAAILAEKYAERTGCTLHISDDGQIKLAYSPTVSKNGFILTVSASSIQLRASDLRGFVMGVETLIKLTDNGSIPICTIQDAPCMDFRGVHLYLPAPDQISFTKRLIKYILSPCGYNHIILEMGAGMRFESHPEINAAFHEAVEKTRSGQWPVLPHHEVAGGQILEKEEVRDLVAYARRFGIEVIPEIQSLSHIQYLTQAHPDIAELSADGGIRQSVDARLEDIPPSEFYAHSCCPSNPKTYQITFDLIDEILDVVQPVEYVHMGHDEVYQIGICPVCCKEDPAALFANDVIKYHDYLAAKGFKMMIWADMLQPIGENNQPKTTARAVTMLPRDIVLLDFIWYFHPDKDIEDNLLPHGYQVVYGNLYSSHFPRYESRIRKEGILGGQISAWVGTCEADLAREGKLYDLLLTAQMLWSADYCSHNRYAYDRLIRQQIPHLRSQLQEKNYPSLCPGSRQQQLFHQALFFSETIRPSHFPADCKADSLIFLHTASMPCRRLPWTALETIAEYRVLYEDGSDVRIPVTYTGNIHHWNRRQNQPFSNMFYRHNGYTGVSWYCDGEESRLEDGRIACIYRYEWINPHPDRRIRQICLISKEQAQTQVLVQSILAVINPDSPS